MGDRKLIEEAQKVAMEMTGETLRQFNEVKVRFDKVEKEEMHCEK
jgi:hypothetical protein